MGTEDNPPGLNPVMDKHLIKLVGGGEGGGEGGRVVGVEILLTGVNILLISL